MAITPMKLATVVGPLTDFDNVLLECIVNHEFHPEPASQVAKRINFLQSFDVNNPYADLLRHAETVTEHIGIPADYSDFSYDHKDTDELSDYLTEVDGRYAAMLNERGELESVISESAQILTQLEHLRGLNMELSDFFKVKYVKFRFGRLPRDTYDNFVPLLNEREDVFFFPTSIEKTLVYGMYMTPRASMEKIDSLFASMQFIRTRISDRVHGTSEQAVEFINKESGDAQKRLGELTKEMKDYKDSHHDKLLSVYSFAKLMSDSYNLRRFAAHTQESFYMVGWVPENELDAFADNIAKKSPQCVVIADEPENIQDYKPPVKLKNKFLFKAFEPFVSMYGLPGYSEIDPTPFMTIVYTILFGIMFCDLGQGAVLAIVSFLLYKFKGMWLGRVGIYFGLSAMVFGTLFGSVFGNEEIIHGWAVLEDGHGDMLLQYSIYTGLAVLGIAMLFNVVNGIRQRNYEKALFGQNGIAGMLLYYAFMGILLPFIGFAPQVLPVPVLAIIAILPVIAVFLREPLAKLAVRRRDWKPHSTGEFLTENIFELIEIVLSYMSNTISFMRIGAYAIIHASFMTVVYSLSATADGGHNIIGLIIGNIIVICIEALLTGIQVLRLHYYEFFSRFYSGDGHPYTPVIIEYKKQKD